MFSSLLIFRLILLYSAWYTDKKELIQKMQTPTTNTKLTRLLWQDHCVSHQRQVSDSAVARRSGTSALFLRNNHARDVWYTKPPSELRVQLWLLRVRLRLKCDDMCSKTRFHLSATRTSPFKSAGSSVQSTTGSRGVHISGSNAGYTMFHGSVKGTGYTFHSPVSPSLPLPTSPCSITFEMDFTSRSRNRHCVVVKNEGILNPWDCYAQPLT